jgi:hypothetical protein
LRIAFYISSKKEAENIQQNAITLRNICGIEEKKNAISISFQMRRSTLCYSIIKFFEFLLRLYDEDKDVDEKGGCI